MDQHNNINPLLEWIERPAFCVCDNKIIQANQAAQRRFITVGSAASEYLGTDYAAYTAFTGGCLYLTVTAAGVSYGAAVNRQDDLDIFILDQNDTPELQALALAAQKLRVPLSNVMAGVELLEVSPENKTLAGQLNQGLYQLQRLICNMSDASRYSNSHAHMEVTDLGAVFDEIMEKLMTLTGSSGYTLHYTGLSQTVIGLADREMLTRAVNNLISNAMKFSPKGTELKAGLTRSRNLLSFTVQDQGSGIDQDARANLFTRFTREPGIEDVHYGMGLGMTLVRCAATAHGGTVLIDQPNGQGTRVTLTIAIQNAGSRTVRTPVLLPIGDYAGGRDHALLELSEVLPPELYL